MSEESSGGSLKGPSEALEGGTVDISVSNGATSVLVHFGGSSKKAEKFDVGSDGKVTISIPGGASGTLTVTDARLPAPDSLVIPIIAFE